MDLSHNNIKNIDSLSNNMIYYNTLQKLDISYNNLCTIDGIILAEGIKKCKSLTYLNCDSCNMREGVLSLVIALKDNKNIQYLSLNNNTLSDTILASMLLYLNQIKSLRMLMLASNNISEIASISNIINKQPKLVGLDIRYNDISAMDLDILADSIAIDVSIDASNEFKWLVADYTTRYCSFVYLCFPWEIRDRFQDTTIE